MANRNLPVLDGGGKIAGSAIDLDVVPDATTKKLLTATERTKLAGLNVGTGSGDIAAGNAPAAAQAAAIAAAVALVDDLSGVTNAGAARTALGLGGAAVLNVGTGAGTVAAGDDSRFSGGGSGLPWLNVMDAPYSANADGATDDAAAIQDALDDAGTAGGGVVYVPAGDYMLSSATLTIPSGVTLRGDGPATRLLQGIWPTAAGGSTTGGTSLINAAGSLGTRLTCSTVAAKVSVITGISSTTGIVAGDFILLSSQGVYWSGYATRYKGEIMRVKTVDSGTQLTVYGVTRDTYSTSPGVAKLTMVSNVTLEDFAILNTAPASTHATSFIGLKYTDRVRVNRLTLDKCDYTGVKVTTCNDTVVDGCSMRDFTDNTGQGQYGYGVMAELAVEGLVVTDCNFARLRHGFTTGGIGTQYGGPHNIVVANCVATEMTNSAYDTHQIGSAILLIGNSASGCQNAGITIRSRDTRVIGNSLSYCSDGIVVYGVGDGIGDGCVIEGNTVRHCWNGDGIQIYDPDAVLIKGNVIDACAGAGIWIIEGAQRLTIVENTISNTAIVNGSRKAGIEFLTGLTSAGHRIERNTFRNLASGVLGETGTTGGMTYAIKNNSAGVTGSWFVGNTAVGMVTGLISDAASNVQHGNWVLDGSLPAPAAHAASHQAGGADPLILFGGQNTTARLENMPRTSAAASVTLTSGTMLLGYFTPGEDFTATNIVVGAGGTASATVTLARLGLYSVDGSGNLTLLQGSTTDTTLLNTLNDVYTKAITSQALTRGTRYAVGVLVVATTAGSVRGASGTAAMSALTPILTRSLSGQTDLPSSVSVGSLAAASNAPWVALT